VPDRQPIIFGTAALDVLHRGPLGRGTPPVTLRWGGVANNVACALAARGAAPILVTADYRSELRPALAGHYVAAGVEWTPLGEPTPLPLFNGELVDGSVARMQFLGDEALHRLTPDLLAQQEDLLDRASVLVGSTDCDRDALDWLAEAAERRGVDFWLVSADPNEVHKLRGAGPPAHLVSVNRRELALWAGAALAERGELIEAALRIAAPDGRCLVTLGAEGALLVSAGDGRLLTQPAARIHEPELVVGAGDVFVGCLLGARLAGQGWPGALHGAAQLTGGYLAAAGHDELPYRRLRPAPIEEHPVRQPQRSLR